MNNNNNTTNNYDTLADKTSVPLGQYFPGGKTEVAQPAYTPPDILSQKYDELKNQLKEINMDSISILLDPNNITSETFDQILKQATSIFEKSKKETEALTEKDLNDVKEEKEYFEERIKTDLIHLESLRKAKEETDFSKKVDVSRDKIAPRFDQLTSIFKELAKKVDDKKKLQETYTKALSYVQNKPTEDGEKVCEFCTETDNAYKYIQAKFQMEDKWVNILDDQMFVSKLRTGDRHKKLNLGDAVDDDVIKTAEELHLLCFTFGHLLDFAMDEKSKSYTTLKYQGKSIRLDIFGDKPLPQTPKEN